MLAEWKRAQLHGDGVQGAIRLDADAWLHLRNMHDQRTKAIFDTLAIHSFEDALAMQTIARGMTRRVWSSIITRHYSSLSLVDLPCQACEFGGILGAVKRIRGGGEDAAMTWLMQHLPGDLPGLKAMGKELKQRTAREPRKGDDLDKQSAGAVTLAWLQSSPRQPEVTLQEAHIRGGGGFVALPQVCCPSCGGVLQASRMGRKRELCKSCRLTVRIWRDYEFRKRKTRRPESASWRICSLVPFRQTQRQWQACFCFLHHPWVR